MDINDPCVPPGFRFHPTEEELVGYYLKRKINSLKIDLDVIVDIDLYRIEPWDIQDRCKLGYEEQNEWYFFSHKDKKYPTGTRTNRATAAGFWKATGRDKAVLSKNKIIGMRKTLVFYKGRAPNGRKSDWIMHEYRLQTSQNAPPQEEGWVVCRAFKKPSPSTNRPYGYDPCWQNHNPNSNYYHMMRPNNITTISTSLATAGSPSSLPDLMSPNSVTIDSSNYNHPPAAFHHQQPLPPFDFDHQHHHHHQHHEFSSSSTNTAFNQEGFAPSQDMSSWKFLDSLLACEQAPPCPDDLTSQLPPLNDHSRVGFDESNADNNDQVGHFLTCFSDL